MTNEYEQCRSNLEILVTEYEKNAHNFNEADTRFRFIDRLLFDCLNWLSSDCNMEEAYSGDYADYTFYTPRRILIVEAKREGSYFDLPIGIERIEHSIPNLMRDSPSLAAAIKQVAGYCQSRGVLFGAVSNGHQVVAFIATRHDIAPLEGRALVFPSLRFMLDNFLDLWNALSKQGIQNKWLETRLVGSQQPLIPPKLSHCINPYPGIKARNPFQADLKVLSENVLEDVATAPELEVTFLKECYCESGALSDLSLLSRDILQNRYELLFEPDTEGPTTVSAVTRQGITPELFVTSSNRRPILILGDVGVGKTIFLRHLMNIDAAELFASAISFHINLGQQATLATDLQTYILTELENQLRTKYDIDVEDAKLIKGVYHGDLQRFRTSSIYAGLKDVNPTLFLEKEIQFLEAKIADRSQHLKHAFEHIEKGRKKQIIIFLDNSDQRDYGTQQQVFLIAHEFASTWPGTVFVTLRPETFHLSWRSGGALSGYHPKAFTIAPPRIDRVLEKRLRFALKLTNGEVTSPSMEQIQARLYSLRVIIMVLLYSLQERPYLGEFIDNIAGGNVRLALGLIQMFFGSGHVNTEKIIRIYETQGNYLIPLHEFLRAVIYGDSVHYDPNRSVLANIFDVSSDDPREHFVVPIILAELASWSGSGVQNGFVETSLFYDRIQGVGFTPDQIDAALVRGLRHRLIETSARQVVQKTGIYPSALRITSVGLYHIRRLISTFAYVDAVIVDTPIFDKERREAIRDVQQIQSRLLRVEEFCAYLNDVWQTLSGYSGAFRWSDVLLLLFDQIEQIRAAVVENE